MRVTVDWQEEAIEAAQNACIYDDKIFLPRGILAIAHCTRGDSTSAKTAWQDARRIRPKLSIGDVNWMARPKVMRKLQAIATQ